MENNFGIISRRYTLPNYVSVRAGLTLAPPRRRRRQILGFEPPHFLSTISAPQLTCIHSYTVYTTHHVVCRTQYAPNAYITLLQCHVIVRAGASPHSRATGAIFLYLTDRHTKCASILAYTHWSRPRASLLSLTPTPCLLTPYTHLGHRQLRQYQVYNRPFPVLDSCCVSSPPTTTLCVLR